MQTVIKGTTYELATTLRVSYRVQGMNNHKPYSEVFAGLGEMVLEKQIEVLYCAFDVANPGVMKSSEFMDYYLDNFNLGDLMDQIKGVVEGIMGTELEPEAPEGVKSLDITDPNLTMEELEDVPEDTDRVQKKRVVTTRG